MPDNFFDKWLVTDSSDEENDDMPLWNQPNPIIDVPETIIEEDEESSDEEDVSVFEAQMTEESEESLFCDTSASESSAWI